MRTLEHQLKQIQNTLTPLPSSFDAEFWKKIASNEGYGGRTSQGYFFITSGDRYKFFGNRSDVNLSHVVGSSKKHVAEKNKKILANLYKIHLMPKDKNGEALVKKLLQTFAQEEGLRKKISDMKVYLRFNKTMEQYKQAQKKKKPFNTMVFPRVVVYPAEGKENAQELLNELYKILPTSEFPGLGIRPRFNAKVNDLIYIAQGDADYKTELDAEYYEEPYYIYYNPKKIRPVDKKTHALMHPETGDPLTKIK